MVSVLIVDDDAQLRKALTRALNAHGFDSEAAGGYSEALTCLDQKPYDVVITDLRMGDKDGIDLLMALRESPRPTRPILMSAYASAKDSQRAFDLGAIRVLCKPFETRDVIEAIERAVDASTGYVGIVHGLSLIDMLQMFHYGRRTLSLEVLGKVAGTIAIKDGEIVDARYGADSGELALRLILTLPAGSLRTRSLQHTATTTIHRDFQNLLLDLLREVDEQSIPPGPPSAPESTPVNGWDARISSQPVVRFEDPFALSNESEPIPPSATRPHPPRAELDACCRQMAGQVAGALSCDILDLVTGEVLGSFGGDTGLSAPPLLAEPLVQLFRAVPDTSRRAEEHEPESQFEEFQLASKERLHFAKTLADRRAIVVVTARRSANIALCWAQLRGALAPLDAAFARFASALRASSERPSSPAGAE